MTELTEKLKKMGWRVETFQPKGEPFPWSLHISRILETTGQKYEFEAYLNPLDELSDKETDKHIMSSLKSIQTKNAEMIETAKYLSELSEITGPVHVPKHKKTVRAAKAENENEVALKRAESSNSEPEKVETHESVKEKAKPVPKKRGGKLKVIAEPIKAKTTTEKTDKKEAKPATKKTQRTKV